MGAGAQPDILVRRLPHIAFLFQLGFLAAHRAPGSKGVFAAHGLLHAVIALALQSGTLHTSLADQLLGLLGILQHLCRVRQLGKHQSGVVGIVKCIMEEPILIRFNLQHVHGGLQPLALLALVHIAEQALNIAQGRQGYRAAEEVHVLLQHAYVVTAPGQQHIILTAPGRKLIHSL